MKIAATTTTGQILIDATLTGGIIENDGQITHVDVELPHGCRPSLSIPWDGQTRLWVRICDLRTDDGDDVAVHDVRDEVALINARRRVEELYK